MNKEHVKLLLDYSKMLGEFTGTLQGIVWWDIPKELEEKLKKQIKELKTIDTDKKFAVMQQGHIDKDEKMANCLLSILDSLKLYDTDSLRLHGETLSEMMFRKMKAHNIDLNAELGFEHLKPISDWKNNKAQITNESEFPKNKGCTCKKGSDKALYCPVHRAKGL